MCLTSFPTRAMRTHDKRYLVFNSISLHQLQKTTDVESIIKLINKGYHDGASAEGAPAVLQLYSVLAQYIPHYKYKVRNTCAHRTCRHLQENSESAPEYLYLITSQLLKYALLTACDTVLRSKILLHNLDKVLNENNCVTLYEKVTAFTFLIKIQQLIYALLIFQKKESLFNCVCTFQIYPI